eukprot:3815087-Pleurochrysis_carterae.AAC.3
MTSCSAAPTDVLEHLYLMHHDRGELRSLSRFKPRRASEAESASYFVGVRAAPGSAEASEHAPVDHHLKSVCILLGLEAAKHALGALKVHELHISKHRAEYLPESGVRQTSWDPDHAVSGHGRRGWSGCCCGRGRAVTPADEQPLHLILCLWGKVSVDVGVQMAPG